MLHQRWVSNHLHVNRFGKRRRIGALMSTIARTRFASRKEVSCYRFQLAYLTHLLRLTQILCEMDTKAGKASLFAMYAKNYIVETSLLSTPLVQKRVLHILYCTVEVV